MPRIIDRSKNRSDIIVTIFALFAIFLAGGISIATISTNHKTHSRHNAEITLDNPVIKAEQAALAGIQAAKGHIECHGRIQSGSLPQRFYANGSRFEVAWEDIDLRDSTVHIISTGFYELDEGKFYSSKLETVIKVKLLSSHQPPILDEYYTKNLNHFSLKEPIIQ